MNFNDDYDLVYREFIYPDCIKFWHINGIVATCNFPLASRAVEEALIKEGFRVEKWKAT